MNTFSTQTVIKLGHKSKLHINVNSISKSLTVAVGPKSKLIVTTNGILQSINLSLNIKLMNHSEAKVRANVIMALNYVTFTTNVIAIEQFANVKLVYNVLMLRRSLLSLSPSFELRGKTTKCVHSISVSDQNDIGSYTSNRLVAPEIIKAMQFYSGCTT